VRFTTVSVAEGLSESVVRAVLQDREGFLWFATDDGLNRFDGYTFVLYKHDPDDPTSLSHSQISALMEDSRGGLWVGTFNAGLNRMDPATGAFTRFSSRPEHTDSLSSSRVYAIMEDPSGRVWVGANGGLNLYDSQTGGFVHYTARAREAERPSIDSVLALANAPEGGLWVGTNHGLYRFDPAAGLFSQVHPDLSAGPVLSLFPTRDGVLWVGAYNGALSRFDPRTGSLTRYGLDATGYVEIHALLEDRAGVLWAGVSGGVGLCRLLPGDRRLRCFGNDPADPHSLSAPDVLSLFEDRAGSLWVGTFGGGVNRMDPGDKPFITLYAGPDAPGKLGGDMVFALRPAPNGDLWVGMVGAGLDHIDGVTGRVTHYRRDPANPNSLASNEVQALHMDRAGTLWVGTTAGLDRLVRRAGEQAVFAHNAPDRDNPSSLQDGVVMAIAEDAGGSLWVLPRSTLHRLDAATGAFTRFGALENGAHRLSDSPLSTMKIALTGEFWLGTTSRGLIRYEPATGRVEFFSHDPDDPGTLSDNYVLSIFEDSAGRLWVGTTGGLNRYNPETGAFHHYRTRDGLPNDFIYSIQEDNQGRLWLSTNKGLARFDPLAGTFTNFDAGDGLQSNEFNMGASAKRADGALIFGGIAGLTIFQPGEIRENTYLPPLALTSLTQHGDRLAGDLPSAGPHRLREVTLRWPENYFDFEFAALNYTRPENNRYAYLLEGFDRAWNEIGRERTGRYTNLPGGVYTLRLRGSNNDGLWNERGAALVVRVIPPVWATWWFRAGAALLALAAAALLVHSLVRGVETRNLELERMVRARTAEIERLSVESRELAVVQERNRLARDLHDSAKQKAFAALAQLGAANGLLQSSPQRAGSALSEAETLVYEVIEDLTFLIQEMYPVALKEKGLAAVLREYIYEWESRSEIRVRFAMHSERRLALQIEQALYRVIQEALANVARHSKAGQVTVQVRYTPSDVMVSIADDGCGFDIHRRAQGVGLRSMRERVAMIGGTITIASEAGRGTCVEVRAPAREESAATMPAATMPAATVPAATVPAATVPAATMPAASASAAKTPAEKNVQSTPRVGRAAALPAMKQRRK
jgi:ligand-binding sensor domain-containing protein/signal transduction histidine kinase